ncbi:MAG: RNA polymerase sporulation sigma factor SigK [Clostridia bacterium]|jgi:RNA polymerase sporulation-specific sigma factor|nr:RNA polymerase sporulation sigma factor SigK [Clostridia bacterium]
MLALTLSGFFAFLKSAIFVVGYIQSSNLFPEPLSSEEEKNCIERMKNGDDEARNILIERNLRLVAHVSKKYATTNIDQDDLISIGTIGLIKGINSFNPDKNIRLATYVARCIENEILMFLRSSKKTKSEVYLNEPIGKDKDDNEVTLMDVLETDEKSVEEEIDLKMKVKKLYQKMKEVLKDREKAILELRFGLNGGKPKTQNEIASMMGISRSYVSRIETKAICKLNKEFQE